MNKEHKPSDVVCECGEDMVYIQRETYDGFKFKQLRCISCYKKHHKEDE